MEMLKKIEVNYVPGTITFPSAGALKAYVAEVLKKTEGLVATDESIKATKTSRTEVNKLQKAIADVRKKYKKEWDRPFTEFESTLKALEGDCKAASTELKATIDSFEDQQKQERRKSVQELITEMAPNYHVNPEDVEIIDKWLLKSTSKKVVLEGVAESMKTLQRLNAEKAQVEKLCLKHGLPAERYIDLLQTMTYIEVEQVIETDLRKQEEVADLFKQQRAAEVAAQKVGMVDVGDGKLIDTETGELKHELQRVSLELQGTKEQIDDIARYIVKSGVKIVSSSERETVIE